MIRVDYNNEMSFNVESFENTVKPVLSGHSKRTPIIGFQY